MIFSFYRGARQKIDRRHSGEIRIVKGEQPATHTAAGLSHDNKFDLDKMLEPPFRDASFSVPPHAPHGQNPKLAPCIRA
jgi:hypothetical protein